jgi:hypothetical protein
MGPVQIEVRTSLELGGRIDLVQLSGTTTVARDEINSFAIKQGAGDGGLIEAEAELHWATSASDTPAAIAVEVGGKKIGYLPGYLTNTLLQVVHQRQKVRIQIFTEALPSGLRTEAWAWLASGAPKWQYSRSNRPPLSPQAKAVSKQAATDNMVAEAISAGGPRAETFKAGIVDGSHYLQTVEPIKQLKREGRLEEALALCYSAIEGAERAAKREKLDPAPWYTEQAAIIHRKLGQRDEEIAVLKRFLLACPPSRRNAGRIKERLDKLAG